MPREVKLPPFPVFGDKFAYMLIMQIAQSATFSNQVEFHPIGLWIAFQS